MTDNQTWLKPKQVQTLRDACYDSAFAGYLQQRNDAIIALLYDAGLRPCEICGLTTSMFDADDGVIRLTSDVQKDYPNDNSPPPATVELATDEFTSDTVRTLSNYLSNRWKESLYLFPSRQSDAIRTSALRKLVTEVAQAADIEPYVGHTGRGTADDVSPYTFRHSVAYRLLNARDDPAGIYDVRNRLRHRSVQTTERHYDHFDWV